MSKVEATQQVLERFHTIVNTSQRLEIKALNEAFEAHKRLKRKYTSDVYTDSVTMWVVNKTLAISRAHRVFVYRAAASAEAALKKVWGDS